MVPEGRMLFPDQSIEDNRRSGPRKWDQGANWNGAVSVVVDGDDDEEAETED